MTKESLLAFLRKEEDANKLRKAIVTKGGDIIEIIDNDYKLENDQIIIKQSKSLRQNKILYDTRILYTNIDYLTFVKSPYA